jgi:predicted RNA-binding Zn-ribbon protein involved in translation (DUF1610 family)
VTHIGITSKYPYSGLGPLRIAEAAIRIGDAMYRCPHCGDLSISGASQFSPPFNGRVKCPTCGTELKVKWKASNFILPIYFIGRSALSFLFGVRFDAGLFWEVAIVVTLAFLQIRLSSYEEVSKPS